MEIHLLGPFRVVLGGQAVEGRRWSRRKPTMLIKLLALQPHHQLHREQVMEMLWPNLDAEAALNNLHKSIHAARRVLEPALKSGSDSQFILTHGQHVHLRAPGELWIDVEAFEQAATEALKSLDIDSYEKALAVCEGDLLLEDPYEDWIATRREQMRMLRIELLFKLSRLYETEGQHQQSIERLKQIVMLDPANEDAHRQLMRLYALVGNRHQALRQYQLCSEALREELDTEPERATRELHQQIVSGRLIPLTPPTENKGWTEDSRPINSLAVLPFINDSSDPEVDYLCGISENIIDSLSQLPGLHVMACSTTCRYKGQEVDPREVGRDLNVRAVVTGRVLQLKDDLVIRVELVDARTGTQLWSERYNRKFSDILALQEEISRSISEKLRLRLTSAGQEVRLPRKQTENVEAYQAYLKGRYFWNKRTTSGLKKGVEYFRQAIGLDPGYANAYAGLSDSYTNLVTWEALAPKEGLAEAKAAAGSALKIDPAFADAHASLAHAMLHSWEWAEAEAEFKRAVELNPDYAPARSWYAEYLAATGNFDAALREARRAHNLDPLSLFMSSDIGWVLYLTHQYDEAIEQYRKTLEMEPNFFLARYQLGQAYARKEQYEEAIEEIQKAVELTGKSGLSGLLIGQVYALVGRRAEALEVVGELNELAQRRHFSPYRVAIIHAVLGQKEQAFDWLWRAYEERDAWLIWLNVDPAFDGLRPDARFAELLRRVGLARVK